MTREELATFRERRRWTRSDGAAVVRALRASGATVAAFAEEHGLHVERLRRWQKRVRKETDVPAKPRRPVPTTSMVPVAVISGASVKLEIVIGGIVVRVPAGFDEATLRRLLEVVGAC